MITTPKHSRKKLKNFKYVEIQKDLGPIPAGTYKLSERTVDGFRCEFEKVIFGVMQGGENFYRFINRPINLKATSRKYFLEKYWEKYYSRKHILVNEPISRDNALTFCYLHPSLACGPEI